MKKRFAILAICAIFFCAASPVVCAFEFPATLFVWITNADGSPVLNANVVAVSDRNARTDMVSADANMGYYYKKLETGRYTVEVNGVPSTETVELTSPNGVYWYQCILPK